MKSQETMFLDRIQDPWSRMRVQKNGIDNREVWSLNSVESISNNIIKGLLNTGHVRLDIHNDHLFLVQGAQLDMATGANMMLEVSSIRLDFSILYHTLLMI